MGFSLLWDSYGVRCSILFLWPFWPSPPLVLRSSSSSSFFSGSSCLFCTRFPQLAKCFSSSLTALLLEGCFFAVQLLRVCLVFGGGAGLVGVVPGWSMEQGIHPVVAHLGTLGVLPASFSYSKMLHV